jgi:hypothetical protein
MSVIVASGRAEQKPKQEVNQKEEAAKTPVRGRKKAD